MVESRSIVTDGNFECVISTYAMGSNPTATGTAVFNSIGKRLPDRDFDIAQRSVGEPSARLRIICYHSADDGRQTRHVVKACFEAHT